MIPVGLSLALSDDFRVASWPLFGDDAVDCLEWSFDIGWGCPSPPWVEDLLRHYSGLGALYGHGVRYSAFSAVPPSSRTEWLRQFEAEVAGRQYRLISEHFGFMSAGEASVGAPMPLPLTEEAAQTGVRALELLKRVSGRPIGIENLALALCEADVRDQGRFLSGVLESLDGFLLLDLHNLHCQSVNFSIPLDELLSLYPVDRVRQVHVAGGSWSTHGPHQRRFRRDTHDGVVPEEVMSFVSTALRRCPNVECVILERIAGTLTSPADADVFREDFTRLRQIVRGARP